MKKVLFILLIGLGMATFAAPPPAPEGFEWVANPDYTDEFNGNKLDEQKWYDHHPRWRGRPPAKFMPGNVSVKGGNLRLTNGMLPKPQGPFTMGGAAVISKKTGAFYGYYECRMKASSISMSSTFWLSHRGDQELDIQETVGGSKNNPNFRNRMNSNTHVWQSGKSVAAGNHVDLSKATDEVFHTYACWWENATTVHFYCNDEHVGTVHPSTHLSETPFDEPMHVNMVTETYDWETPPTPKEISNPKINTTLIDWVRAYTLQPTAESIAEAQAKETREKLFTEPREWKSANGKSTTTATLIKVKAGYAFLKKEDGKEISIRTKLLCKADRELLDLAK